MRRPPVNVIVIIVGFLIGAVGGSAIWAWYSYTGTGPLDSATNVVVPKGAGVADIAERLHDAHVIASRFAFRLGVRIDGLGRRLKAGEYEFPAHVSVRDAARIVAAGRTVKRRLTIAEGLTTAAALALVGKAEGLEGPLPDPPPAEGALLPETYFYAWGDSRAGLVRRMKRSMKATLAALWAKRAKDLAIKTPEEAVILASIIEKETARPEERAHISAVFQNRLRRGMKLQSDPTVVYALTGGTQAAEQPLTHDNLGVESPYNTYLHTGLPPGPIANPGRASLFAALHPNDSDDFYFVADGSGGHAFARTLPEHNRNVARLRRIERAHDLATDRENAKPAPAATPSP